MLKAAGLYETKDKNGNMVLSGNLGQIRVMIFKNTYKKADNQPDYNLLFAENNKTKEKVDETQNNSPLFNTNDEIPF
jgi:hypothetical protein